MNPKNKLPKRLNWLRGVPNTWCKLVNTQVTPCIKCKRPGIVCTSWHLKYAHQVTVKPILKIWEQDICPIVEECKKNPQEEVQKILEETINIYLNEHEQAIAKIIRSEKETIEVQEYKP